MSTANAVKPMERLKITPKQAQAFAVNFLASGDYKSAARLMWPWFQQNEQTDRIWKAIEKYDKLCIMGHGSASKTFTASIWFLLDWLAHAETTALVLTSSTVPSMDRRIWADFKTLWTKSKVDLSKTAQILDAKRMIRLSITEGKAAIHAVAAESDNAETKIQGMHMPRNRVVFDEADNPYSSSIWPAITNLETSGHFKGVALANPVNKNSQFGFHCEPVDGWDSINPEVDTEWEGKLGWHVLRLDGLQSPNLLLGKDKYPYLLSNKAVTETRDNKGTNSPEWWTMIRAFYPPEGLSSCIFHSGLVSKCNKVIVWYADVTPIGFIDPAFEGGDNCVFSIGVTGRIGATPKRIGVEQTEQITIKRKDMTKPLAFDFADQIVSIMRSKNILPKHLGIDTTGTQGPFADVIAQTYGEGGNEIVRVNFGGSASDRKITAEDTGAAKERYKTFVTELWYVAREWCRLGLVHIKNPSRDLRIQLESRLYELKGKDAQSGREVIMAETKKAMKSRGLTSPDEGDSFCGLIHIARSIALGFLPGTFRDAHKHASMKAFTRNASVFQADYGVPDPE